MDKNEKLKTGEIMIVMAGIDSMPVYMYENECFALVLFFHNFVCALSYTSSGMRFTVRVYIVA